ncbi:unnamed protein product [Arabidopsis arenosa]|uniref:Uncharacterized protein n=1 Tax=Arabidopsis arenosa TaxID=38785 RepID=A0A8S2B913_ARAAE|nr:unnamed protein product [Arabidopsis arenosa]
MDDKARSLKINKNIEDFTNVEEEIDHLRRGPWTVEEDFELINYIATHGEGRWNSLARCAGRTDNEIKNYWRTRVQKHAKQLKCDVNSQQFKDTMKYLWMPRLVERIQAASTGSVSTSSCITNSSDQFVVNNNNTNNMEHLGFISNPNGNGYITPDNSNVAVSPASDLTECHMSSEVGKIGQDQNLVDPQISSQNYLDNNSGLLLNGEFTKMQDQSDLNWFENVNGMIPNYSDSFWNIGNDEDYWLLQQHQQVLDNGSF